ncbi:MAG: TonB-dependent receptor [Prevotella sp.]|nr:TonB-dependent receptor [Prevotella sp.]
MQKNIFSYGVLKVMLTLGGVMILPQSPAFADISTNTFQQAKQSAIHGTVVDEQGEPMIGVTVKAKGSQAAAITDIDGNYSLNVANGTMLEFSYVGYTTQTVKARNGMKVKLEPDSHIMDEVVVIGYGTQKKRDLTGAVSSVKSEDIKKAPVMNAMEGLQGRISGLDITRESGQAGSSPNILLRGNRSLNASCAPLYVIDGVQGGNIDDINPNDIETIDVLKDASSTAIYGAAGANGVIIVTTKQGITGKIQVDFNGYIGVNAFPSYPETYTGQAWIDFITEGFVAREGRQPEDITELFNVVGLTTGAVDAYNQGKWINWRDEILHTGMEQNYSLSLRGGTEHQKSYLSAGYQQEKGLYKDDKMEQLTFRAGTTYNVNKVFSVGFQSTVTYRNQDKRNSRLSKSLNYLPLGDVYNEDGSLKQRPIDDMNSYINILADDQPNAYENNTKRTNVNIAPFIEIKPIKGLTYKSLISATLSHSRGGLWDGLDTFMKLSGSSDNKRISSYDSRNSWSYTWQNILTYGLDLGNHSITLTGITEYSKTNNESATATNEQFEFDGFKWYHLQGGLIPDVSSEYKETAKMSYAFRGTYNYLGKYLFSASIRWDGASQLYNKWCAFPAFSAGWRISDEAFMKGTRNWLDNLKFRVGYGVTGNANISPYVTTTEVTSSANPLNLGGGRVQTYILTQNVANNELTWEKSYNWNFGLDFAILGSRIDGSIEYYTTDTKGVLYNRPLPTALGLYHAKAPYKKMSNIARIKNKGIEVTINSRNIETKNFSWSTTLTFAKNIEKLKEINLGNNVTTSELIALNLFLDEPVNTFYGYKKDGIWQLGQEDMAACFGSKPGDVRINVPGLVWDGSYQYTRDETVTNPETGASETVTKTYTGAYFKENANGEREYFTRDHTYGVSTTDKQILGHKTPDWTLGFSNQFEWKDFDLSIMCSMRWGQMINGELLSYMDDKNQPVCYDYWTPTNPTNAYPRHEIGASPTGAQKEAMRYVDGSFFKIKNITLGYSLPKSVLNKINMTRFRIYATVQNPFIWSKSDMLKGMDPENNASDKFPLYRTLVFGVNASF